MTSADDRQDIDWERGIIADLAQGGEPRRAAITALYQKYSSRLGVYFRSAGATPAQSEDWTQETFVRLLRTSSSFRGDSRIIVWLWAIGRNVMLETLRGRSRKEVSWEALDSAGETVADEAIDIVAALSSDELSDCVAAGLKSFEQTHPDRAQCIKWVMLEGMNIRDLSVVLGRTPAATREYLSQCRKKLRKFLAPCQAAI